MKKVLIILNDLMQDMYVGKNSNLAYICACLDLGFEVFIYVLPENNLFPDKVSTFKINDVDLVKSYKKYNSDLEKNIKLQELISIFTKKEINLNEVDLVIQRLEPMKSPFPPHGKENINQIFKLIQKKFPNKIINLPINLSDKGIIFAIDEIITKKGEKKIGIETKEFSASDDIFPEIYQKTVIKPKDLAQSIGVFALEKKQNGFDLEKLKNELIANLINVQIYQIKDDLEESELKEIILILLALQALRNNKILQKKYQKFSEIGKDELTKIVNNLYDKILLQPFLEGVKFGDIRTLFLKDSQNKFYIIGNVFRQNARINDDRNFTTSYSTGAAKAVRIEELNLAQQKNLFEKSQKLLEILNNDLAEKYKNSLELGADFILVDDKTVLLGEINHTCIALLPIFEALYKEDKNYDGGLFYIKKAILDVVVRQENGQ